MAKTRLFSVILQSVGAGFIGLVFALPPGLSADGVSTPATAASSASAETQLYAAHVRPFLESHCFECHGPDVAKAGMRLDTLPADFSAGDKARLWTKVLDRLDAGEMPPKKSTRPPVQEQKTVLAWINGQLLAADQRVQSASPYHMRRLTRLQYENTLHDLLAINVDLKGRLPEDSRALGFDNVGDALTLSPAQIEAYLDAADAALDAAVVRRPRPQTIKRRYLGRECLGYGAGRMEGQVLDLGDAAVVFGRGSFVFPATGEAFTASADGLYRLRASLYAYQSKGEPVEVYIKSGPPIVNHPVGYFSAQPDTPGIIDVTCRLERGDGLSFGLLRLPYYARTRHPEKSTSAGLAVQWIEVEGPLIESWPPQSHRMLFGDLPLGPRKKPGAPPGFLQVACEHPKVESERLLRAFMRRAYRRPVTSREAQPFIDLVAQELEASNDFEDAMRAGYKAILCSPDFLFLQEKTGQPDEFALAARLSYFLWNTAPDEQLLDLAERGMLSQPQTLDAQVERLLDDPRAEGFIRNFVAQWLDLRLIDFTTPDKKLYPEYDLVRDGLMRQSLVEETDLFFTEVLKKDLSLTNFVDSDFSFLNDRLAQHYGIAGVKGPQMRRVSLPSGSHRGGVLTQASILKVTANGTTTSPVLRGVWVLRNLLGRPPEPPPPNAGAIEPDIRGAKTIREQLEKHRRVASCASCHVKIDPIGFALENFDVMGGWQEKYRVLRGPTLAMARDGPKVETVSGLSLPDGTSITNVDDLKRYLLSDKDQLARCLAEKLLVYSTGRGLSFSDRPAVKQIVGRVREKNYGLRALVHVVVKSRTFLNE
jgi:mono/diheme cytochrome c family protein